jgi:hypothetical protein
MGLLENDDDASVTSSLCNPHALKRTAIDCCQQVVWFANAVVYYGLVLLVTTVRPQPLCCGSPLSTANRALCARLPCTVTGSLDISIS